MRFRKRIEIENPSVIEKLKKAENRIEKALNIEITIESNYVEVTFDDAYNEGIFEEIINALDLGFDVQDALLLLDPEYAYAEVDIEEFTGKKKSAKRRLLGRVIGRKGRSKENIEKFTGTKIVIGDRKIGIIGKFEDVINARTAVEMLLSGRKHSTVYRYLDRKKRMKFFEEAMKYEL